MVGAIQMRDGFAHYGISLKKISHKVHRCLREKLSRLYALCDKVKHSQLIVKHQNGLTRARDLILITDLRQFKKWIIESIHIELSISDLHSYADN